MKTAKFIPHTPGPWQTQDNCPSLPIAYVVAERPLNDDTVVASCQGPDRAVNVRLLAAAPDLLAALREILAECELLDPGTLGGQCLAAARAALSKAEGHQ